MLTVSGSLQAFQCRHPLLAMYDQLMRHSRPNLAEVLWTQVTPQQFNAAGRLNNQQTGTFHFCQGRMHVTWQLHSMTISFVGCLAVASWSLPAAAFDVGVVHVMTGL